MTRDKLTHKLAEEEKKEIVAKYRSSFATSESLAREYSVSSASISYLLRKRIGPAEYRRLVIRKRGNVLPEIRAEIVQKYRATDGTSTSLAEEYGLTDAALSRILRSSIPRDEYEPLKRQKRKLQLQRVSRSLEGRKRRSETMKALWTDPKRRGHFLRHLKSLATQRAARGDYAFLVRAARGIKGWYHGVRCGEPQWFDSTWELAYMQRLDGDKKVIRWRKNEREVVIPYIVDGKEHFYVPDFIVERGRRTELVEVKGPAFPLRLEAKLEAASTYCKRRRWRFIVVAEKVSPGQLSLAQVELVDERMERAFPTRPADAIQPKVLAEQLGCSENTVRGWMRGRPELERIYRTTPTGKRGAYYWRHVDG